MANDDRIRLARIEDEDRIRKARIEDEDRERQIRIAEAHEALAIEERRLRMEREDLVERAKIDLQSNQDNASVHSGDLNRNIGDAGGRVTDPPLG
jgi:hypothetical protein